MEEQSSEHEEDADIPVEEIAEEADTKIDALIELLIEKGFITEEEFDKKHDDFFEDDNSGE